MPSNYYESDRAVSEYLLLHYGTADQLPEALAAESRLLNFPERAVTECLDLAHLPAKPRALDLGSAVGRSSFELARWCDEVVGIEYSRRFVAVAKQLRRRGSLSFEGVQEGELTCSLRAIVPREIDRGRVHFERGDAMHLRPGLGQFDVVLMANLIDRLSHPRKCLHQLPALVKSRGQLILTSPYTWLREYTPRKNWLGGFMRRGKRMTTFETLNEILSPHFRLASRRNLGFLIREHARKFQLGLAEATVWMRKQTSA